MKISYNWLKEYLDLEMPAEQVADILTEIGLEVEHIEQYESIQGGLKGIVVGHVLHREQHPNADRLSLTKVTIGNGEPLQIVCGAPNVAEGQKVVVATVGATLYPNEGDAFKIKKSKIRGIESIGMICAEDELGLGQSHDGIMVLPEATPVGLPASDYFKITNDTIFEIGLTPNRSDATAHLGVAEDLAAALKINYEHTGIINKPDVATFKVDNNDHPIAVKVEDFDACPRYSGVSINNITVKESPKWLQERLETIGVRPINNIVDITNFILHELGQPLHAFDAAKIKDNTILVKHLPEGATFTTLDEVERTLSSEDLMICNGASEGMCIAGVFGGIKSGVTDTTTSIFLESAHFHPKMTRRTSTRHDLRTDAARCFEKGSDPNNTVYALKRAALLIQALAGGTICSEIVDIYPNTVEKAAVKVNYQHINRLIGVDMSTQAIKNILDALHIDIKEETATDFVALIPTNKHDVTREADVIEEILRIYGFNNVEIPVALKSAIAFGLNPDPHKMRNLAADQLAAAGYYEMMATSLSTSRYYEELLPMAKEHFVYVNNTSNRQLDLMRPSMLFGGLEAILHNQNRQTNNAKLFEFGKTYSVKEGQYEEQEHLSLFATGQQYKESWLNKDKAMVSYYTLKASVEHLLQKLGITNYQTTDIAEAPFAYALKIHRGPIVLAEIGKVQSNIVKQMDIKKEVFFADMHWDNIMTIIKKHKIDFQELSKFPSVRRDLALVVEKSINFNDIVTIAKKQGKKLLKDINLFDVYEHEEQLGANKKSYSVSFIFQDATKTLKDKDIDKTMTKMISVCEKQLNALIRK